MISKNNIEFSTCTSHCIYTKTSNHHSRCKHTIAILRKEFLYLWAKVYRVVLYWNCCYSMGFCWDEVPIFVRAAFSWECNCIHFDSDLIDVCLEGSNWHSIMMLMKFSDLSKSDCSNWVMWQVGVPCHVPDLGGTGVWHGKNGFHKKCKNLDNIAVYLTAHFE